MRGRRVVIRGGEFENDDGNRFNCFSCYFEGVHRAIEVLFKLLELSAGSQAESR